MEIQKFKIDGKKVFVLDGIFSYQQVHEIYGIAKGLNYRFSQLSDDHSHIQNMRPAYHLIPEDNEKFHTLYDGHYKALKKLKLHKKLDIAEVYVNIADAMTVTLPHSDRPSGCWTALYYANPEWDIKYSGATNFINKKGEIALSCVPKPGRFAIFEADILHQALPPTFYCPFKRITIPFKMDPIMVQNEHIEQGGEGDPEYTNSCW